MRRAGKSNVAQSLTRSSLNEAKWNPGYACCVKIRAHTRTANRSRLLFVSEHIRRNNDCALASLFPRGHVVPTLLGLAGFDENRRVTLGGFKQMVQCLSVIALTYIR